MKLSTDGVKVPVVKTKRPKFSDHGGRSWDYGYILIDGEEFKAHLDTTWGQCVYFQYGETNQWYKMRMFSNNIEDLQGKKWDIDPFSRPRTKLVTG